MNTNLIQERQNYMDLNWILIGSLRQILEFPIILVNHLPIFHPFNCHSHLEAEKDNPVSLIPQTS